MKKIRELFHTEKVQWFLKFTNFIELFWISLVVQQILIIKPDMRFRIVDPDLQFRTANTDLRFAIADL